MTHFAFEYIILFYLHFMCKFAFYFDMTKTMIIISLEQFKQNGKKMCFNYILLRKIVLHILMNNFNWWDVTDLKCDCFHQTQYDEWEEKTVQFEWINEVSNVKHTI